MDSGLGIRYEGRDEMEQRGCADRARSGDIVLWWGVVGIMGGGSGELLKKRCIVDLVCVGQAWDLGVLFYLTDFLTFGINVMDRGTGWSRLAGDRVSNDFDSLHED